MATGETASPASPAAAPTSSTTDDDERKQQQHGDCTRPGAHAQDRGLPAEAARAGKDSGGRIIRAPPPAFTCEKNPILRFSGPNAADSALKRIGGYNVYSKFYIRIIANNVI